MYHHVQHPVDAFLILFNFVVDAIVHVFLLPLVGYLL
jgi:hypothetical protein